VITAPTVRAFTAVLGKRAVQQARRGAALARAGDRVPDCMPLGSCKIEAAVAGKREALL
jgi:hypothetical protein